MKSMKESFLFQNSNYNDNLFHYIMGADRVNKNDPSFSDIIYEVKRQQSLVLMKVLTSSKIVLMINDKEMSRSFKVVYANDVKEDKEKKVFIDCTGIIEYKNGAYVCKKVGNLVSYLMTAMTYILYDKRTSAIVSNSTLMKTSTAAFVDLMIYILGYLKVPVTLNDNKERMSYVIAEYFQRCVVGIDNDDTVMAVAKHASRIAEKKTCDYLHVKFADTLLDGNCNIDQFIKKFAEVFMDQTEGTVTPKNRAILTTDTFIQRWMYAFGPSTLFAPELFVPFTEMITDCYIGAFINQQNTIEKVVGKNVTAFSNELLKVGSENA